MNIMSTLAFTYRELLFVMLCCYSMLLRVCCFGFVGVYSTSHRVTVLHRVMSYCICMHVCRVYTILYY